MTQWRLSCTLRQVRVPEVPQIRSRSQMRRRWRSAQHLTWSCGVMSLVEYSNQLRKKGRPEARAFPSVRMQRRRPRTSSHTHVSEIGAATACEPEPQTIHITDNPRKNLSSGSSWPTTRQGVVHNPGHVGCCSRHDGGNQRTEESGLPYRWRTGNPRTGRGNTIRQERRNCHRMSTQVFLTIDGSCLRSMNKELCGLVRCFRIYLLEMAKLGITTESPLFPWLVRHCGWILSRHAVRADGRTG